MYSEVIAGLYCGDASAALARENEKFDCILNMAAEVPFSSCLADHVEIHKFDIIDDECKDDTQCKNILQSLQDHPACFGQQYYHRRVKCRTFKAPSYVGTMTSLTLARQ